MLSYADVTAQLDAKPNLLLGNGHSIAYDPLFDYRSLWDVATQNGLISDGLRKIARKLNTTSFEDIVYHLDFAATTLLSYGLNPKDESVNQVALEIRSLRHALVDAISRVHLVEGPNFTEPQKSSAAEFISRYCHIYTTNYDLLLYWLLQATRAKLKDLGRDYKDGFRIELSAQELGFDLKVLAESECTVQYLHGALHLFRDGSGAGKYRVNPNGGKPLKDTIYGNITGGIDPLTVMEGDHRRKRERIQQNSYLSAVHNRLLGAVGDLVVFGSRFGAQDSHIIESIAMNEKITRVFIGTKPNASGHAPDFILARVDALQAYRNFAARLRGGMPPLEVAFYNYESIKPWGEPGQKIVLRG